MTSPAKLTLRDLNRATLARQLLLAREKISVVAAVERLAGLQAQAPAPPYIGLWTRLAKFARADLAGALDKRTLVRAPWVRTTLHLVTAGDYLAWRALLQPMFAAAFAGMPNPRLEGIDAPAFAAEAEPFLRAKPRTQDDVRNFLAPLHPKLDVRMMGHAVRLHLPLVQTPGPGTWGFPPMPEFALAEAWLGRRLAKSADPRELARRYLAAFGPAAPRDVATWSGSAEVRDALTALRPELKVFVDEKGRELFDLPDAPRPGGDAPAPPRLLPEWDNLLLSHADRARVVPEVHRKKVFLPGLRVAATLLVDGFAAGTWKLERTKKNAALVLEPFGPLAKKDRAAIEGEAEQLAEFLAPDAAKTDVKFQ